jgi:hypothetical protein
VRQGKRAISGALVVCLFAAACTGDATLMDTPAAAATSSATPRIAAQLEWTSSEIAGTVSGAGFDADLRTWIALGADSKGLAAWTSSDAKSWNRHDVAAAGGPPPPGGFQETLMGQAVPLGASLYSLGIGTGGGDAHQPLVWRSSDGLSWDALVLPESFATMAYLIWGGASSPSSLVALGHRFGTHTGSTWVTQDGTSWSESFPNSSGPATESGIDLHDIVYDGAHFLVVGETKAGTAGAWLSEDGLTWTASKEMPDLASSSMHAVEIAPGGGFAAVGLSKNSPAAWTSPDGVAWHRAEITSPIEGAVPYSIARLDTGVVALGTANGRTVVWTSASGADWTEQASALDGLIPSYVGYFGHDLAAPDGRAILAFVQSGVTTKAWKGAPAEP